MADIPRRSDFAPPLVVADQAHEALVRLLLEAGQVGGDTNDSDGRTHLIWVIMKWNEPIVRLLLEHDTETDVKARNGQTPLLMSSSHAAFTKMLLAAAAPKRDNHNQALAPFPAKRGHKAIVQLLFPSKMRVASNVDSNHTSPSWATDVDAMSKLHIATGGFDIDVKDHDGSTLLLYASTYRHEDIVKLLLATGVVDISTTDNSGRILLSCTVEGGHKPIARQLVATGKANSFAGFSQTTYAALLQNDVMSNPILAEPEANLDTKYRSVKPLLHFAECEAMFRLLIVIDYEKYFAQVRKLT